MSIARPLSALFLLTAGLTACSAGEPPIGPQPSAAPSGSSPAEAVATCSAAIDRVAEPPEGYVVAAGVVAVPSSERLLQVSPQVSGTGPARMFAKWGLLVRADSTAGLRLPSGWSERARLSWGNSGAEPGTGIRVTSCPAEGGEAWTVFAGGTWVAEADCVPILVTAGTKQVTVEVSAGAPCSRPGG